LIFAFLAGSVMSQIKTVWDAADGIDGGKTQIMGTGCGNADGVSLKTCPLRA